LRDSAFIDNLSGPGDANATGGALTLGFGRGATIERTRFIGNVTGGNGGAIKAAGGLITDSYFSRNRALRGGAVTTEALALEVRRSTFEGNEAGDYGGAFSVEYSSPVTFTNVTITGNRAASQGGGLAYSSHSHPFTLQNVTIADNHAGWRGGGLWFYVSGHEVRLRNTIVARNTSGSTNWPDLGSDGKAYTSQGYNLIGNRKNAPYTPAATDIAGTDAAPIDPRLGPLAGYGGATPTRALLDGSPAIDAGHPMTPGSDPLACAATDQRGFARPGAGSAGCDIGAFERTTLPGPALAVGKTQTDGVVYVGQPVTYRITLVNNGDEPVTGIVATDQAPPGLALSNATYSQGTCHVAGSLASCEVGIVAPGALVTIDVVGVALEPGVIVNGVQVTADASAGLPPGGLTAAAPVSSRTPIVVTTLAQSPGGTGDCTLGEAIQAANTDTAVDGCVAGHGRDLILLPSGTLLMTAVAHADGQGATALPIITAPVEIRGQGAEQTIVQRDSLAPDMRLFRATSDAMLSHLTVRGGRVVTWHGGAWLGGALTTEHVRFENNYASHEGGAVSAGTLVARDTRFASNHAGQVGGAASTGTARLVDTVF
ncbi:MAG: choice-of-anchor Q domain-containing protein, partial [Vicinamibacteria bacterium]